MRRERFVAVIEDDPALLTTLSGFIKELGFPVRSFASAEAALVHFDDFAGAGLLLTDFGLPGVSGADLITTVRACWPQLPVAIVTGHKDAHIIDALSALPNVRTFVKPFPPLALENYVVEVMRREGW